MVGTEKGHGLAWGASWGGRPGRALLLPGTCFGRLTLPCVWAEAGVGAQAIQAGGSIPTLVPDAVVGIHITVQAYET